MTDRYCAFTVVLERDIREDDAEHILNAIRMVKGVQAVEPVVADPSALVVEIRVRSEMEERIWAAPRKRVTCN